MPKVLYVATVVKTHIMHFHIPFLSMLKESGYETAVAAKNDYENPGDCNIPFCDKYYDIPFSRSPFSASNIRAYKSLKKLIEAENYDIIHCHTPMGGIITRFAAKNARKKGTKVVYTAHGFHFFKGAPLINWLLYYPVEKIAARYTDLLITINKEDYELAKRKMKAGRVEYIEGVGVDLKKFSPENFSAEQRTALRKSLGVKENEKMLLSVGELIKRKNHETVLNALQNLKDGNYKYFIVGSGTLKNYLEDLIIKKHLEKKVTLLGYRTDVAELLNATDLFVFPSLSEGLPVALMEAIASNTHAVCSRIRGNNELVPDEFLFNPKESGEILEKLNGFISGKLKPLPPKDLKDFEISAVKEKMKKFYETL